MHQTSRKSVLRKCSLPLWRWAHCYAVLALDTASSRLSSACVKHQCHDGSRWGLAWGVCWLHRAKEVRLEGVTGAAHVAPQPRRCWWSPVLPWTASWGWELFVLLLQCRFVEGMWKEQILRKRKKRRKGWGKWIVKKEGKREVKEWRKLSERKDEGSGEMGRCMWRKLETWGPLPRPVLALHCLEPTAGDSRASLVGVLDTRHVSWSPCSLVIEW